MDHHTYDTADIREELSVCENLDDLKEMVFPMLKRQKDYWAEKISEIRKQTGYSEEKFAAVCGVSRATVIKWQKGAIPKSRETFLRIGMAAGFDEEQMNRLLQRYGRYPGLYSKSLEDCVCKFVLAHCDGAEMTEAYSQILDRVRQGLVRNVAGEQEELTTSQTELKLSGLRSADELEQFIAEHTAIFATAYHRFHAYVKMCIESIYADYPDCTGVSDLAAIQGWSSSLRQRVSAIWQGKWYPTRNKIISLGLHLGMGCEEIDHMLEYAYMEPLCAKNLFESVIIFAVENAELNSLLDRDDPDYDPDALCKYVRTVLEELNLDECEEFLPELTEIDDGK